jgi:hypothetical protein
MLVNWLSNDRAKCSNIFCSYSMLNGIIDLREVRSQKVAQLSQSLGSTFVHRHSEDELDIIKLKEAMR